MCDVRGCKNLCAGKDTVEMPEVYPKIKMAVCNYMTYKELG